MGITAAGQCQQQGNREDSHERFHTMTPNPPFFPVKVETRESSLAEPARGPGELPAGLVGRGGRLIPRRERWSLVYRAHTL